ARLAVVPPPEEPELPIPSPAASQPPPIALAPATPQPKAGTSIPQVNWLDGAPAADVEDVAAAEPQSAVALAIADMMDARASEPKAKAPEPAAPADETKLW